MIESGLTPDEQKVMNGLVAAWDAFIELDYYLNDDLVDFRQAIHAAQRILATRVTARSFPDYWNGVKQI